MNKDIGRFWSKHRMVVITIFIITLLFVLSFANSTLAVTYGDINNDGTVNILDVNLLMGHILGIPPLLTSDQQKVADVNGDGEIDIVDVSLIMQQSIGVFELFPVESGTEETAAGTEKVEAETEETVAGSEEVVTPTPTPTPTGNAKINPDKVNYSLSNPADVVTTITWNEASEVTAIVGLTKGTDYNVTVINSNTATLTILISFLQDMPGEAGDAVSLTINFNKGSSVNLLIVLIE